MAQDKVDQSFYGSIADATSNTSEDQKDEANHSVAFWSQEAIDAARWNQRFPYQFLLVKAEKDKSTGKTAYVEDNTSRKWVFTLPIPPESLQKSLPFADNLAITQGGAIIEHNGIPTRQIVFSGTMGVLPLKGIGETRPSANFTEAIFAGTIQSGLNVTQSAQNLASNFTDSLFKPNIHAAQEFEGEGPSVDSTLSDVAKTSGYYQMRLLTRWLENYAAFKLTEAGKEYRLAFAMWKDQAVYLVKPNMFTMSRSAGSPLEYMYNFSLTAWRRTKLNIGKVSSYKQYRAAVRSPNDMARFLKAINDSREVLNGAINTLSAVGGDIHASIFEPLRQLSLFAKDIISSPLTLADLPISIVRDMRDTVIQFVSLQQSANGVAERFSGKTAEFQDTWRSLARLGSEAAGQGSARLPPKFAKSRTFGDLQPSSDSRQGYDTSSATDPFRNPDQYYHFFNNIQPGQMPLPPAILRGINNERERVRRLTRLDFENMLLRFEKTVSDFNDAVGSGNITFNNTYGRTVPSTVKTTTQSDYKVMFALNRVVTELSKLASTGDTNQSTINSIDFIAGLASRSGIAFTVPKSKYLVPFPYGGTLEGLARQYLGDPDKWIEIAALNGLRIPFVDEVGFQLPLLVNGSANQVQIADSTNLFVNQAVWIGSRNTARTQRRITNLRELAPGQVVVTVDGDQNLSIYKTLADAYVQAFLPDTVNSLMSIYIPSEQEPATVDFRRKAIPAVNEFDDLLAVGGVDLLLTPQMDLAMTPDGDTRLAIGLTNIVQGAKIALSVVQGKLLHHPGFGLPIKVGQSLADLDSKSLLNAVRSLFRDDSTFTGAIQAAVQIKGPVTNIQASLGILGRQQTVPISVDIRNRG